jgi:microcystin-dependent protein
MPTHSHTGTTDSDGNHNHTVGNIPFGTQGIFASDTVGITAANETTTTYTSSTAGAHTHTFTSNNNGGSQAHNNMQPTLFGCNVLIYSKHLRNMTPMVYV